MWLIWVLLAAVLFSLGFIFGRISRSPKPRPGVTAMIRIGPVTNK